MVARTSKDKSWKEQQYFLKKKRQAKTTVSNRERNLAHFVCQLRILILRRYPNRSHRFDWHKKKNKFRQVPHTNFLWLTFFDKKSLICQTWPKRTLLFFFLDNHFFRLKTNKYSLNFYKAATDSSHCTTKYWLRLKTNVWNRIKKTYHESNSLYTILFSPPCTQERFRHQSYWKLIQFPNGGSSLQHEIVESQLVGYLQTNQIYSDLAEATK